VVTDRSALRYFFVSSYGREGPFADIETAIARADTLATRAAVDGRDEERPRLECSDGSREELRPFGAELDARSFAELPRAGLPTVLRERETVAARVAHLQDFEDGMDRIDDADVARVADRGARAIYLWTLRRTALLVMRQLPELRPLADTWERRWYGAPDAA